jgi:hypothetical protein
MNQHNAKLFPTHGVKRREWAKPKALPIAGGQMRDDPYNVAENACGAVVAILMLIALYAGGGDARKTDSAEEDGTAGEYATVAASADGGRVP